ncbi:TniQ family protein [Streptomyces sp. PKU-MA01144]|uniref:TniQ family protein n=1 Tax=Streptomyces sp. PKU-MA01144 TaxID=2729138 RepID=UPI00147A73D4|nr:TniQ family protein [Streptomyces sp. PKU-MA01144]NNJ05637.1 TniQ family protein [Streptomyces sp. PKU-MA01144]
MAEEEPVRRLGVVPAPFPGEAFVSWVDTVAASLRVSRAAALRTLGLPGSASFSTHQFHLSPEQLEGLRRRTGLRPAQVERMLFAFYAPTALPQLVADDGRVGQGARVSQPWLRRDHSAACPLCVEASGGRWLLSWRLRWTFLCADHLVYLVDRCPRCGLRLYWRLEATGAGQRTHCMRPAARNGRGGRRLGTMVCGFPVAEMPALPVGDEEAVHVQRRVQALLTPADVSHNETSRRLLQQLVLIIRDVTHRKTLAGLLGRMEGPVIDAVHETRGQPWQPPLSWTLANGTPAAVSALVRIAARSVRWDTPRAGPPG